MPSSLSPLRLTLLTLFSATTLLLVYKSRCRLLRRLRALRAAAPATTSSRGKVFFISQTSTSRTLAQRLHSLLTRNDLPFDLVDPRDYEPEDLCKETVVIVVASTWENGASPQNGEFLVNWVNESTEDFRVGSGLLENCKFAVFGVGSRAYGDGFNVVAKGLAENLRKLGGKEVLSVGEGDVDEGDLDKVFGGWSRKVVEVLKEKGGNLEDCNGVGDEGSDGGEWMDDEDEEDGGDSDILDLEDLAGKVPPRKDGVPEPEVKANGDVLNGKKEMVTPAIRANLVKQVMT